MTAIKFTAVVATTHPDSAGDVFAPDALQAVERGVDVPLLRNFDRSQVIGQAHVTHYRHGKLYAAGEVETAVPPKALKWYCVPGGMVLKKHEEDGVRVIDEFKIVGFSLTLNPTDPNLTPIKTSEENNDIR